MQEKRTDPFFSFGDVGPLRAKPNESLMQPDTVIPFGDPAYSAKAALSINVVAPRSLPLAATRIREIMSECKRICFLGFGFWKENLDLLELDSRGKQMFASCYKLSADTKRDVLVRFGTKGVHLLPIIFGNENQDVSSFLSTEWRVLA
jgi:hypothetical protein